MLQAIVQLVTSTCDFPEVTSFQAGRIQGLVAQDRENRVIGSRKGCWMVDGPHQASSAGRPWPTPSQYCLHSLTFPLWLRLKFQLL